jgi:hypothetical protein
MSSSCVTATADAPASFQSIEHMANVAAVFSAIRELLRPGGAMIVSVPSGSHIDFNERRLNYFDMPPNHVGRWYRESFAAIAARAELTLVGHELEPRRMVPALRRLAWYGINARASRPGGLARRIQALRNRPARMALKALIGSLMAIRSLPFIAELDSGCAQLAILQRPAGRSPASPAGTANQLEFLKGNA